MTPLITLLGVLAGLFALALLLLPAWRILQGRLPVRQAQGLWIAGAGFALLAAAALLPNTDTTALILPGVALTVAGNIVQRRNSRGTGDG